MFASLSASAYCMASSLYPKWKCGKKRCSRPAITLRTLKPANDEPKFLLNSGFLGGDIGEDEDVLTRTRVLSLFSSRHTAMFGFVAENPLLDLLHLSERSDSQLVKKTILISFRGSLHPKNFVYDLHFAEIDYEYPDSQLQGARIHSGFWKTWQSVSEQIVTQVRSTISNHLLQSPQVGFKHFDIWISGHSLGGAVACICALELQKLVMNGRILPSEYYTNSNWQQPQLRNRVWYFDSLGISIAFQGFSFGEPRAGNAVFAEWVTRLEGLPFYRTTFYSDLVVHLPPKRFPVLPNMDFHHHASEYYIRKNQRDTLLCDHDDSNGNSGNVVTENPVCSGGVHFRSLLGHLTYFDIVFGPWC